VYFLQLLPLVVVIQDGLIHQRQVSQADQVQVQ
jgi:hypothetical protein